jgi:hypothetical protein
VEVVMYIISHAVIHLSAVCYAASQRDPRITVAAAMVMTDYVAYKVAVTILLVWTSSILAFILLTD